MISLLSTSKRSWSVGLRKVIQLLGGVMGMLLLCLPLFSQGSSGRILGTVTSPPQGMTNAVIGKEFDFIEADVFEFDEHDRIVRQTIYADALTLMNQLGEPF